MNNTLLTQIRTQLLAMDYTEHCFYYHLPSENYLKDKSITYTLDTTAVENTFDGMGCEKTYSLAINFNAPTLDFLDDDSIYSRIYALRNVNSRVRYIELLNSSTTWNADLQVFTESLNFNIKYS